MTSSSLLLLGRAISESLFGNVALMIALVTGGTRGGGRGIAVELGAAGATVYVTGRSSAGHRSPLDRPETIEETAALVDAAGGAGIPVRVDHSDPEQVARLAERIDRLDLLVNGVWGGDPYTDWAHPLWEQDLESGLALVRNAVETHVITSHALLPKLIANGSGLVIELTDGNTARYRGSFFYDLAKHSVIRLAQAQAVELRPHGVAAVALTPGFLRSEAVLEHFNTTEDDWSSTTDPDFARSESPAYLGRAVVALASDPNIIEKSGRALATAPLAREYGFTDADGTRPDFEAYWAESLTDRFGPLGAPL
jgi:NAD(P)-dependent dehydrogenase (short-subunit alcohol dehydrogenase family)